MPKFIDYSNLIGRKIGKLTILDVKIQPNYKHRVVYKCDCGNIKEVQLKHILHKENPSCGCLGGRPKTYDMKNNRLARIWRCMINRCRKSKHYKNIKVCEDWKNNYYTFENWALKNGYNDNLTIDRINVYGNYTPENCRWVDFHTQLANTGVCKRNKSGYKGVSFQNSENKWRSDITINRKRYFLGLFETKEKAHEARIKFIKENNLPEYNEY